MSVVLCRECRDKFETTREWQVFCTRICRIRWHREHKHCFYCGSSGIMLTRDHVLPVVARSDPRQRRLYRSFNLEYVWACNECNGILNCIEYPTIADRVNAVANRLWEKYKLFDNLPKWTEKELKDLGPKLRSSIKRKIRKERSVRERVFYAKALVSILEKDYENKNSVT